jgi:hypothetical protein
MLRVVLLGLSLIFIAASPASAQEVVKLRVGEHEGYARLVFDTGKTPYYSAEQKSGELILKFNSPAKLDDSAFKADVPNNVTGVRVISDSPLQVAVTLKAGATTRDFTAGNRVVVDIYDPPNTAAPTKASGEETEKKKEPTKIASAPVADVAKQTIPEKKPQAPPVMPPTTQLPKSKPQPTAAPNADDLKKLQQEQVTDVKTGTTTTAAPVAAGPPSNKPNIIMLTATKSTGLAVFDRGGKIWIVSDQEDLMMSPNVTGPQAKEMMPPGAVLIEGGKAYTFPKLNAKGIQGQAGGLVWRVVAAPHPIHLESIKPKREDENGNEPGGGKIIWELQEPGHVLDIPDPVTGRTLKVVTVNSSKFFSGQPVDFVEFETILTPVGLVVLPKVDDLTVEIHRTNVVITRPGGLQLMPEKNIQTVMSFRDAQTKKEVPTTKRAPEKRIFDFNTWQMGGLQVLEKNRNLVLSSLGGKPKDGQVEGLISLARMHLANGLWAEAIGFLQFALDEVPELENNPEFIALSGATHALGNVSDLAFEDLNDKGLESYPEIGYWKAYTLADLEDWQQAGEVLPADIEILAYYPEILISRLGLVLAEVALRSGKLDQAEKIIKLIDDHGGELVFQQEAALAYLKGEAARQHAKPVEAINIWTPLTTGKDAMYRAKSGLAITRLQYESKQITAVQAIDKLERLRYAWRGDELEALINYWLGRVYFDTGEYIKGLNIMRDAATFSEGTDLGDRILSEMVDTFEKLFTSEDLKKISGPDAAALYDEFAGLIPSGEKGDLVAEKLADHLVSKELLGRSVVLMQSVLAHKQGADAFRIATKLAAIELLDAKPVSALSTLGKAREILDKMPEAERTPERYQEVSLLRARALSQERRPDQALALLHEMPRSKDVNKLRADIAWRAGYWDDAAEALGDVISDEEISLTRPLTPEHTSLIMQRAVALSLASDRIALANMREKYSDSMTQTDKTRIFEVITRARQSGALADRETLTDIVSEVDLFKQFLENYRATSTAPTPEPAPTPPPADAATTPPPAEEAPAAN